MSIGNVKKTEIIQGVQPFESLIKPSVGNEGVVVDFYSLKIDGELKISEFSLPSLDRFISQLDRK